MVTGLPEVHLLKFIPAQEGDAVNVLPVHVQQLGVEGGDSWEQVLELEHHLSLDGMHAGTLQAGHLALHRFPDILSDGLRPRNITQSIQAIGDFLAGHG